MSDRNRNVILGIVESPAIVAGALAFEVLSAVITSGGTSVTKAAKAALTGKTEKLEDYMDDVLDDLCNKWQIGKVKNEWSFASGLASGIKNRGSLTQYYEELFKKQALNESNNGVKINKAADIADEVGDAGRAVGKGATLEGESGTLYNVNRIDAIEVTFKQNKKHNSAEFARQLKEQEKGMNGLTIDEYLKNRDRYLAEGRALEGDVAQKAARENAYAEMVTELREKGYSSIEAEKEAQKWLDKQAALHNPDQIAGGNPNNIGGLGDRDVKFFIGCSMEI